MATASSHNFDGESLDGDIFPESPEKSPENGSKDKSNASMRQLKAAFSHAKDNWQIDGDTLKGFYLDTQTDKLYCWEQAAGVLYEFQQDTGACTPIWSSADAAVLMIYT